MGDKMKSIMRKIVMILGFAAIITVFVSCEVSNKKILRYQKLEEGVSNPTTIEELKDAIKKYGESAADVQMAVAQVGILYKIH